MFVCLFMAPETTPSSPNVCLCGAQPIFWLLGGLLFVQKLIKPYLFHSTLPLRPLFNSTEMCELMRISRAHDLAIVCRNNYKFGYEFRSMQPHNKMICKSIIIFIKIQD